MERPDVDEQALFRSKNFKTIFADLNLLCITYVKSMYSFVCFYEQTVKINFDFILELSALQYIKKMTEIRLTNKNCTLFPLIM